MPAKLSIAIPVYNCAHFLAETLSSAREAAPADLDYEIVVIDDGSHDDPKSVVEKLGGPRARYLRQDNQGPCAAFNACVRESKGEIIHLLHGDDRVRPGFYHAALAAFEDPKVGMYVCRCMEIDGAGREIGPSFFPGCESPQTLENYASRIVPRNYIRTPGVALRKAVYEDMGPYLGELNHTQDWHMWLKAASWGSVRHDPATLADYRIHEASDTSLRAASGAYLWETWRCVAAWSSTLDRGEALRYRHLMDRTIVRMAISDAVHSANLQSRAKALDTVLERSLPHLKLPFQQALERNLLAREDGKALPPELRLKTVIFGAGIAGQTAFSALDRNRFSPLAFIDNAPEMLGQTVCGIPVLSPSSVLHLEFDRILLASAAHRQMASQLRAYGLDLRFAQVASTLIPRNK